MKKLPIKFGTIIIDKLHQFFGKADPIAFVVTDAWSEEGEDEDVFVDHYRGRFEEKYSNLRDPKKFEITNLLVDPSSKVRISDQLKKVTDKYQKEHKV